MIAYNFVVSISGLVDFFHPFSKLMVGVLDVKLDILVTSLLLLILDITTIVSGFVYLYITNNREDPSWFPWKLWLSFGDLGFVFGSRCH